MLLYRNNDVQLFAFHQGEGRFTSGKKRGSFPSWGVALRFRDPRGSGRWRHIRWRLGWRGNNRDGAGVIQAEYDSWLTTGGTTDRCSGKSFIRFKAGRGKAWT